MKSIFIIFSGVILALALFWFQTSDVTAYSYKKREIKVRTTAYTHSESDHVTYGRQTALGTRLKFTREYTSAASDWSRFPVGTEFRIKGLNRHFVIDDYGSALLGKDTIDLYFPSRSDMNRWGVKNVEIIITKYGDYDKSKEVLAQRKKYRHCRKMLADIEQNGRETKDQLYEAVPPVPTELDPVLLAAASIPKNEWKTPAPELLPDPRQPVSSGKGEVYLAKVDEPTLTIRRGIRPFRDIFASSFQTVSHWSSSKWSGEIRIPITEEGTQARTLDQVPKTNSPVDPYQSVRKPRAFRPL